MRKDGPAARAPALPWSKLHSDFPCDHRLQVSICVTGIIALSDLTGALGLGTEVTRESV